ncbi:hypothetical protein Vafri_4085, partial [Volvox africanus]
MVPGVGLLPFSLLLLLLLSFSQLMFLLLLLLLLLLGETKTGNLELNANELLLLLQFGAVCGSCTAPRPPRVPQGKFGDGAEAHIPPVTPPGPPPNLCVNVTSSPLSSCKPYTHTHTNTWPVRKAHLLHHPSQCHISHTDSMAICNPLEHQEQLPPQVLTAELLCYIPAG